jgi:hypothetical protein
MHYVFMTVVIALANKTIMWQMKKQKSAVLHVLVDAVSTLVQVNTRRLIVFAISIGNSWQLRILVYNVPRSYN